MELIISIEDNGTGFDSEALNTSSSFGLPGMRERAAQCGGMLEIQSRLGKGMRVELSIPTIKEDYSG